ncbi:hypothetical protein BJX70DRAFT_398335 [Aspergillus crustosus]
MVLEEGFRQHLQRVIELSEQEDSKSLENVFKSQKSVDQIGFFDGAADIFSAPKDRMVFKTFDCGQDHVALGYAEGSWDVVVTFLSSTQPPISS